MNTTNNTMKQRFSPRPPAAPLDEARWAEWIEKGRAHDRRVSAAFRKGLKGLSMLALVAAAIFWSHLLPYDGVARFAVSAAALAAAVLLSTVRQYAMAAVTGAIALIFSPIAPALSLGGDWRRTLLAVAAVLLVASFADFEKQRKASNV
jgi:hypothetical protein